MDLDGKVAVITGGASGLGLATARRFAAAGSKLVLADIEPTTLATAVAVLEGGGAEVLGVPTDVTREEDVLRLRDEAVKRFGTAHLIFNNAGVAAGAGIGTPTGVWKWVLDVNLNGVIYGVNAFVPLFLEQGEGHVVNTASLAGLGGAPGMGPYCASKFAVVGLSEVLFHELALSGANVHVSVLCPGFVKTHIHESTRNIPGELSDYLEDERAKFIGDMAAQAVNAGVDPSVVGDAVYDAVTTNAFWILTHKRSAIGTTEMRLEWMKGGEPPHFDLMRATQS